MVQRVPADIIAALNTMSVLATDQVDSSVDVALAHDTAS